MQLLWAGGDADRGGQGRLPAPTRASSAPALSFTFNFHCGCHCFVFWRACDKSDVWGSVGSGVHRTSEEPEGSVSHILPEEYGNSLSPLWA